MKTHYCVFIFLLFSKLNAQNTIGVISHDPTQAFDGYNLLFPSADKNTYLIDNCGRVVHQWTSSYIPGQMALLLEDGNLLRTYSKGTTSNVNFSAGGGSDGIQLIDWNGNVLWDYAYSDSKHRMHHDIAYMPNGNILVHAWEMKSQLDAFYAGYDTTKLPSNNVLWSEELFELQPLGKDSGIKVWEWHVWDHLVQDKNSLLSNYGTIATHAELININYISGSDDFLHINSVDYNLELDQIIMSVHAYNEVWIIDHSTTTAQAATHSGGKSGKGGDLLYRWGNPSAYDMGSALGKKFYGQHNAHWIPKGLKDEGKILVFNNGTNRPGNVKYSSVEIFVPPLDSTSLQYSDNQGQAYEPAASEWIYTANPKETFYSKNISGAQRLPNGNTLICNGNNGIIFEINSNNETVWEYVVPLSEGVPVSQGQTIVPGLNSTFRCYRYASNYVGLNGKNLNPGNYIELNPDTTSCAIITKIGDKATIQSTINIFPNPANSYIKIQLDNEVSLPIKINVFNSFGKCIENHFVNSNQITLNTSSWSEGLYFIKIETETQNNCIVKPIMVVH